MKMKVELPKTTITPARGRIYCKAYPIDEKKAQKETKSGIILLPGTQVNEKTGEKLKHYVYLVVKVGPLDGNVKVEEAGDPEAAHNQKLSPGETIQPVYRDIRRGDQVYWFMPIDAQAFSWAIVIDWETGEELIMFHESEMAGAESFLTPEDLEKIGG